MDKAPESAGQSGDSPAVSTTRPPKKDHRSALQSQKLRMSLLDKAIRFGQSAPAMKIRSPRILLGSAILGAIVLAGTIGASALIQFFFN